MPQSLETVNARLQRGEALSADDARSAMITIAEGAAPTAEIVDFLRAYNARQVTAEELTAFVTVLRGHALRVEAPAENTLCNCGTGGDGRGTINVSTMAAFVVAAAGVPVAKHGNRSVSSRCGSTDCLAALGIRASRDEIEARDLLGEHGLCFLNAPDFHPAMRHVAEARGILAREGQKTVFNLLGPLLNPARVTHQSMGVFSGDVMDVVAETMLATGTRRAHVYHGDGYDEIALTGSTRLLTVHDDRIREQWLDPEDLGMRRSSHDALRGGDAEENAKIGEQILRGRQTGPTSDMIVLNAAAGISAGSTDGRSIEEALPLARRALTDGAAMDTLQALRKAAPRDA